MHAFAFNLGQVWQILVMFHNNKETASRSILTSFEPTLSYVTYRENR